MILKQKFPADWYYSPLYSHRYVLAAGIMSVLWWFWIFPILFESSKSVFAFPPFAVIMLIIWLILLGCCIGMERGRMRPMDYDPVKFWRMEEDYPEKKKLYYTKIDIYASQNVPPADSPTISAENTPAMYTARTGRESMDSHHTTAVNVLTTVELQTERKTEEVEMKEACNKNEEARLSSSWSSSSNAEDLQQQPELSVDDENDIDSPHADKTLTPRQIFFSDLLRHSEEEPMPRDRRSCFVDRPQQTLTEKRKSMPLYLYIGETRTLSYTDQEAVTEDPKKTLTSASDSLSSPAQHITSDELRSNMSRLRDEQERQQASREKRSSSSSGAEYFIANVSRQKSVTSEVYITIDEQQKRPNKFAVVHGGKEQKLVAVTDKQRVASGDNDDALSDCVFLDETPTGK